MGVGIDVKVTFRWTSRLSVRIGRNGEVRVSAPHGYEMRKIARFVDDHFDWIENARQRTLERTATRKAFFGRLPLRAKEEREEASHRMDALITPLVEKYARLMGVSPTGVSYEATISRWGRCHIPSRRVQFSYYLLLLPEICAEYIVVHELAHLIEPSHNRRFHETVGRYFAFEAEARALIKKTTQK